MSVYIELFKTVICYFKLDPILKIGDQHAHQRSTVLIVYAPEFPHELQTIDIFQPCLYLIITLITKKVEKLWGFFLFVSEDSPTHMHTYCMSQSQKKMAPTYGVTYGVQSNKFCFEYYNNIHIIWMPQGLATTCWNVGSFGKTLLQLWLQTLNSTWDQFFNLLHCFVCS